jgi:hypothetical protein
MRNTPIDLQKFRKPLHAFFQRSIRAFVREHPAVLVSTVGFYVFPYSRFGSVCLDTEKNSAKAVATYQDNGPAWYGEDSSGRFNKSPADFSFANFTDFKFTGFPDLDRAGDHLEFIDSQGTIQQCNREAEGDEAINRAMFPTLCEFVREFASWALLRRSDPFRIGVVMHDSRCLSFWQWAAEANSSNPNK